MIKKYTISKYQTWNHFKWICAILQHPLKYFNYFSQKDHYGRERHIDWYNKSYKKVFNDRYVKDEKFQENI